MSTATGAKAETPDKPLGKGDHLFLIDGSGYIFRAYHALPPLTRKSDGMPMGAVSGFCNMLYKLLEDTKAAVKPSHFAVIFDTKGKTFRSDIYDDYKANRDAPPDDLIPQFSVIRDAVRAFNVPSVELAGFEADDLIATYAVEAANLGAKVTIVSSDKDLMQLVTADISMLDTMKNRAIGVAEVMEKFGVGPDKVIDVQSLAGDSVDNVPGVPGIGVKTAALLVNEYGDLDTILQRAEEVKQNKRRENLIAFADQARVSRELVTLRQDVPVEVSLDTFGVKEPDAKTLLGFLKAMELGTLTRRIAETFDMDPEAVEPAPEHMGAGFPGGTESGGAAADTGDAPVSKIVKGGAPGAVMDRRAVEAEIDASLYETVTTLDELQVWVDGAKAQGWFAFDTETNSLDAMSASLVGFSISMVPGKACYVPLLHGTHTDGFDLGDTEETVQIPLEDAVAAIKPLLADPSVMKVGQNIKYDMLVLAKYGLTIAPIDDTMLLSYALDAGVHPHGMDALSELFLGHKPIPFKEVVGTGKKQLTFDQVPVADATRYAAEDADITGRLYRLLKPRLAEDRMTTVYETLERPLAPVLVEMERCGVKVDRQKLQRMSGDFAQRMLQLEAQAHSQAGEPFNMASPKQVGEILFGKLGISGAKKTKTGAWATGADILEDLAAEGHELPKTLLAWRQLSKLKSTYTDSLPDHINEETGRIHTSYSMAGTSTGRLASTDPNLQNIPIRTEEGRAIRTAFIPEKGNIFISADYSQVELRVLAHMADIDALKQAFLDGLDIHAMTASEMFGVPIKGMDPMIRRNAKAINFGIIYGISAFGLARQLSIPRKEAADYIETYFAKFPGIRDYMETTKEFARANGYVETLFGRRIHVRDITSKNGATRGFMERAAINAPIQGTAADIIRRAMIRMPGALKDAGLDALMLLQVHDELIFEVPEAQAKATTRIVRDIMEGAALPACDLGVPLTVDVGQGANWDEAH
jgi:DNA polymerase-1